MATPHCIGFHHYTEGLFVFPDLLLCEESIEGALAGARTKDLPSGRGRTRQLLAELRLIMVY